MLRLSASRRWLHPGLLLWLLAPVLLWWTLRAIPLTDLALALGRLDWLQILTLLAVNVLVMLTFCARWWLILHAQNYRIAYPLLAAYRLAAFSISYFTPGPHFGGEPLQVYLIRRRHGVPADVAAASVGLDKLLELVVNSSFLLVGVILIIQSQVFAQALSNEAVALALLLMALPLSFLMAIWAGKHPLSWLFERLPTRYAQGIYRAVKAGERQAIALCREHPLALLSALLVSLISWVALVAEYWLAVHFLDLDLTLMQLVAIITAARVAILMPFPGGLGALEAGQVWMFSAMGFDPTLGLSVGLLIRARDLLFGGMGLWLGALAAGGWQTIWRREGYEKRK